MVPRVVEERRRSDSLRGAGEWRRGGDVDLSSADRGATSDDVCVDTSGGVACRARDMLSVCASCRESSAPALVHVGEICPLGLQTRCALVGPPVAALMRTLKRRTCRRAKSQFAVSRPRWLDWQLRGDY